MRFQQTWKKQLACILNLLKHSSQDVRQLHWNKVFDVKFCFCWFEPNRMLTALPDWTVLTPLLSPLFLPFQIFNEKRQFIGLVSTPISLNRPAGIIFDTTSPSLFVLNLRSNSLTKYKLMHNWSKLNSKGGLEHVLRKTLFRFNNQFGMEEAIIERELTSGKSNLRFITNKSHQTAISVMENACIDFWIVVEAGVCCKYFLPDNHPRR